MPLHQPSRQIIRDTTCAVEDPSRLTLMYQGGFPLGRIYNDTFHQASRCPCCAYVRFPDPPSQVLDNFYQSEYPEVSKDWYNPVTDYSKEKVESRIQKIIEILDQFAFNQNANLHEFGCAFGGTVHGLNGVGYSASGTELNGAAVVLGRELGNDNIHAESAIDFIKRQDAPIDVVYSFHALEHFTDPFAFLRELREIISPDGLVISFLPNSAALFPLIYGHIHYVWFGYPEHLHLFSPGAADALARVAGYELLLIKTNPVDIGQSQPIARALHRDTVASRYLRNEPADRYGEELVVVITPKGSRLLERFETHHLSALEYSRAQSVREKFIMDQMTTFTPNPWVE